MLQRSIAVIMRAICDRHRKGSPIAFTCVALCVSTLDLGAVVRGWVRFHFSCANAPDIQSSMLTTFTRMSKEAWWMSAKPKRRGALTKIVVVGAKRCALSAVLSKRTMNRRTEHSLQRGECSFLNVFLDGICSRAALNLLLFSFVRDRKAVFGWNLMC